MYSQAVEYYRDHVGVTVDALIVSERFDIADFIGAHGEPAIDLLLLDQSLSGMTTSEGMTRNAMRVLHCIPHKTAAIVTEHGHTEWYEPKNNTGKSVELSAQGFNFALEQVDSMLHSPEGVNQVKNLIAAHLGDQSPYPDAPATPSLTLVAANLPAAAKAPSDPPKHPVSIDGWDLPVDQNFLVDLADGQKKLASDLATGDHLNSGLILTDKLEEADATHWKTERS